MEKFRLKAGLAAAAISGMVFGAAAPNTAPVSAPATTLPDLEPNTTQTPGDLLSTRASVLVKRFSFEGNTKFSDKQLLDVVTKTLSESKDPWPVVEEQSVERLEDCRLALSRLYADKGYVNSGAILPDQNIDGGVITFQIIEGTLSDVQVSFRNAHHLLRRQYIIERVKRSSGPPLNILKLKDELELLRLDPNIRSINAELKPGIAPGQSILDVQVQENNPFQLGYQFSNRRPPSVGSIANDIIASDSDLTGRGDLLSVRFDVLSGPIQDLRPAGAKDFSVDYSLPVTPADTALSLNFTRTDAVVVDQVFSSLNISSESASGSITLRQPLYRRPTAEPSRPGGPAGHSAEIDVFISGALRDNRTSLAGQPFSFSPGDHDGTEHVTALRFGQELTLRNERDSLSARSTFSLGVNRFDSTQNRHGIADGDFFDWLGQVQYVRLLGSRNTQLVMRAAAQLSDRSLLTLEQFSLGGMESVRGYPENFLVRDEGVAGAVELHLPVLQKNGADVLTLVPFFDAGYGYNRSHLTGNSQALDAIGIGLQFNPNRHFSAQIFYGAALQNHAKGGRDVENLGLHFNILVLAF